MPTHIMLDLETLGTADTAAILSIGAVVFDPATTAAPRVLGGFYQAATLPSQHMRQVDPATLAWWLEPTQAPGWRAYAVSPQVELDAALHGFYTWLQDVSHGDLGTLRVWANAPSFDCRILHHACHQLLGERLWPYWNERCYRTMKAFDTTKTLRPESFGTPHDALNDATWQVHHLQNIIAAVALRVA